MIPATPTTYRGTRMRSRLEAKTAAWLDRYQIPWVYQPCCFADERGEYYPDFRLDDFGVAGRAKRPVYVEVKPTWEQADQVKPRMEIIWSSEPHADLLVIAPGGYLDFAFGAHLASDRTSWLPEVGRWKDGWRRGRRCHIPAEAGTFNRCAVCKQATLTIWSECYACARCGAWDGDHHLNSLTSNRLGSKPLIDAA